MHALGGPTSYAILIVTLVSLAGGVSAQTGDQHWEFTNQTTNLPDGADFLLVDGDGAGTGTTVQIPPASLLDKGWRMWAAEDAALVDVNLSGVWDVNVRWTSNLDTQLGPADISVQIGVLTGPEFSIKDVVTPTTSGATVQVTLAGFVILPGQFLAVNVTNDDVRAVNVAVTATGSQPTSSFIESPTGSDDYPVPEVASIALLGVGIIAIAGVVRHRRNK